MLEHCLDVEHGFRFDESAHLGAVNCHQEGHEQINSLVEAVQSRFPGFRFALIGAADGYGDNLRFSWGLGPENGEALIKGTDFAELQGGKLKSVRGFIDLLPEAA